MSEQPEWYMTEPQWLACDDPMWMLDFLGSGQARARKLRLFGCACVRLVWHQLWDERSRRAVEVSERYADGAASEAEMMLAYSAAHAVVRAHDEAGAERTDSYCIATAAWSAAHPGRDYCAMAVAVDANPGWSLDSAQVGLLRCSFGNPFRSPAAVEPTWLACNDHFVVRLARSIYDDRRFDDLPILADALEEAGCTSSDILAHCRGSGPHSRGCWPLDLLLARS
jgi:hypothetical protein